MNPEIKIEVTVDELSRIRRSLKFGLYEEDTTDKDEKKDNKEIYKLLKKLPI